MRSLLHTAWKTLYLVNPDQHCKSYNKTWLYGHTVFYDWISTFVKHVLAQSSMCKLSWPVELVFQLIFNSYFIIYGLVTSVTLINGFISFPWQPYLCAIFKIKKLISEAFFLIYSQGVEIIKQKEQSADDGIERTGRMKGKGIKWMGIEGDSFNFLFIRATLSQWLLDYISKDYWWKIIVLFILQLF